MLTMTTSARAQTPADDIRSRVKEGQEVVVTDAQGREVSGRIRDLSGDRLRLEKRKTTTDIPFADVIKIDRPRDGLGNGAGTGFMVGAGLGLLAIVMEDNRACDPTAFFDCSNINAAGYTVGTLFFGGLGSAIGVGIDALIRRDPQLYRRGGPRVTLAPALNRGSRGVALSVSW